MHMSRSTRRTFDDLVIETFCDELNRMNSLASVFEATNTDGTTDNIMNSSACF